jgi:hypothetical protein
MKRTRSVVGDENFTKDEKNSESGARKRLSEEGEKHEEVMYTKSQLGTRRRRSKE